MGYRDLRAASSGYAIQHIIPKECGKEVINDLKLHNILKYCIGNSVTEVPMWLLVLYLLVVMGILVTCTGFFLIHFILFGGSLGASLTATT